MPSPWRENWWLFLVVLLLVVGGIVAFFALREEGPPEPVPVTGATETRTETVTTVETRTETVAATHEEPVAMPDLVGAEYEAAVEQLLDMLLLPESEPVESEAERGTIVAQEPGPGARIPDRRTVHIEVSLGAGEREELEVPDLTGGSAVQALAECAAAGFTCRLEGEAVAPRRQVTSQEPAPGTPAPALSQILLSQG